jgi:hypothetical protein
MECTFRLLRREMCFFIHVRDLIARSYRSKCRTLIYPSGQIDAQTRAQSADSILHNGIRLLFEEAHCENDRRRKRYHETEIAKIASETCGKTDTPRAWRVYIWDAPAKRAQEEFSRSWQNETVELVRARRALRTVIIRPVVLLNAPDMYLIFYVSVLLSLSSLNCWYLIQHLLNAGSPSCTDAYVSKRYIDTYVCVNRACTRTRIRAYQRSEASRAVPRWTAARSWITTDNNRNVNYTRFSRPQKNSSGRNFILHFSRSSSLPLPLPPPPLLAPLPSLRRADGRAYARAVIFMIILMAHKKFTWPLNHSLPSSAVYYVPTMPQDCSKLLIHIVTIAGSPNCESWCSHYVSRLIDSVLIFQKESCLS